MHKKVEDLFRELSDYLEQVSGILDCIKCNMTFAIKKDKSFEASNVFFFK